MVELYRNTMYCQETAIEKRSDSEGMTAAPAWGPPADSLGDFRTDQRMLLLSALAIPIGVIGALGALLGHWLPAGDPGLWVVVGMGAIMGGTMRSPLTGRIFILELTHDLNALPALFIGSVAALGVTVLVLRRSILTEKLARRGQHIAREYSVDLFELVRVGEVMDRQASAAA
ncbi:MAG: chloride channel protein [Verrucomicrobiota bacterium]|nr:chloride channel protein [Verrucomicrobiota bacterium]